MREEKAKLVYSTEQPVPHKGKPSDKARQINSPSARQNVIVRLDRKSRGGKSVTVIEGIQMPRKEKKIFLKKIKAKLGTGGTIKDSGLEIQGDHRDMLITELEKMGCKPKRSGG